MVKWTLCVVAISIVLVGCATTPLQQEAIRNSTVVPDARDRVWARIISTTPRSDLSITGVDKVNGVVSAELSMEPWDHSGSVHSSWALCGGDGLLQRPLNQHADVKIIVLPDPAGTSVTINARFTELRQDRRTRETRLIRCTSTGLLEQELLDGYWEVQRPSLWKKN